MIGVRTHQVAGPANVASVPGLRGGTAVSFCNGDFLRNVLIFRQLESRIIRVNRMTCVFPKEIEHYKKYGLLDGYVFQSDFHCHELFPNLAKFGVAEDWCRLIRGVFALDAFPFKPLPYYPREPFAFGRIARPDLDKWISNLWPIYRAVQYWNKQAKVMAWGSRSRATRLKWQAMWPPRWNWLTGMDSICRSVILASQTAAVITSSANCVRLVLGMTSPSC